MIIQKDKGNRQKLGLISSKKNVIKPLNIYDLNITNEKLQSSIYRIGEARVNHNRKKKSDNLIK